MKVGIINCFDTYEHRADLIRDTLKKNGYDVQVFTSDYLHIEKKKRTDNKEGYVLFHAVPYKRNLSLKRLFSHRKLSRDIFAYLEKNHYTPDLIWVLLPPNSFAKDAVKLKSAKPNIKIVFDVIDLWPETMPLGLAKKYFPFSVWASLRNENLRCADFVFTECDLYREKISKYLPAKKTETLYLAHPLSTYKPELSLPADRLNLCYLGSINNIIDIEMIAGIIRQIRKQTPVNLHIIGDGEKRDELIHAAENAGASVDYHGMVYDAKEKERIFNMCHYGLNIMKKSVCVGLTMKSVDYFEFGLPLINNIHGDTWEIVDKNKVGININKPDELRLPVLPYSLDMRERTRKFFEEKLTLNQFESKVIEAIQTCLDI